MLLEDGHCMRDHALDACKLRGTDKLNAFSASSLLSLVAMVDADMAVRANAPLSALGAIIRCGKNPVPQIGLGQRAQPYNRTGTCEESGFGGVHMRGVNEAPARVEVHGVGQELDRTFAVSGLAVSDFLDLFGNVDVDRILRPQVGQPAQILKIGSAQAVWRNAEACMGKAVCVRKAGLAQTGITSRVIEEATLALMGGLIAKPGPAIEHR